MRKFMKLVEGYWETNVEIEHGLNGLSPEERNVALDGIELLHDAGAAGLTLDQWMGQMKQLWGSEEEPLRNVWKLITHSFPHLVRAIDNGHYVFHQPVENTTPVDTTSPLAQAAKQQIDLTGRVLELCSGLGRFTEDDVLNAIAAETSYPASTLRMFVDHVLNSNIGVIKSEGNGVYRYEKPLAKSGMGFWRDLEGYQPPKDA